MDATVNDFFNEINEIGGNSGAKKDNKTQDDVWEECHDERTGFPYYWNTVTDEVTWTKPKSFRIKGAKQSKSVIQTSEKKASELFLPPASANHSTPAPKEIMIYKLNEKVVPKVVVPMTPTTPVISPTPVVAPIPVVIPTVPIYSLQHNLNEKKLLNPKPVPKPKQTGKKPFRRNSDSDEEKIELITSYGDNSDSESEKEEAKPTQKEDKKTILPTYTRPKEVKVLEAEDSDEDEEDLLVKIQKRAKELKSLGGDVPPEVKSIIEKPVGVNKPTAKKAIAGFSLVGAYSDSEEELENEDVQSANKPPTVFNPTAAPSAPISTVLPETGHSTLFPITKPVDVNDFVGPKLEEKTPKKEDTDEDVDVVDKKVFQRKRRIGVSLINTKKPKDDIPNGENEHKGLGFKSESEKTEDLNNTELTAGSVYPGFQKGGVMFVKSDQILKPSTPEHKCSNEQDSSVDKKTDNYSTNDIEDDIEAVFKKAEAEDSYNMIKEKLSFLSEGRPAVLPVQVMLIQAETLFIAMKENSLKVTYLQKWLEETSTELIGLEKQAAPDGWLLKWDRSHKRYYYQNQITGETQWQYPEPDVDRCDEAMDICTTPPPQPVAEPPVYGPSLRPKMVKKAKVVTATPTPPTVSPSLSPQPVYFEVAPPPPPPSPPRIRHPSPPPPPNISSENGVDSYNNIVTIVPALDVPLPPADSYDIGQPLPPGVDVPEAPVFNTYPLDQETNPAGSTSDFSSVLDSFYSEIAETANDSQSPADLNNMVIAGDQQTEVSDLLHNEDEPAKKKKKKVKTAGLSLKKKGVSQLVEKWKSVQNDF